MYVTTDILCRSVIIATVYEGGDWIWLPVSREIYLVVPVSRPNQGLTQPSVHPPSSVTKPLEHKTNHLCSSSAKVICLLVGAQLRRWLSTLCQNIRLAQVSWSYTLLEKVNQYSAGNGCYIFILHGLLTFLYLCNMFIFFPHPSMNKVNTVAYLSFRCHYFELEAESCVSVYRRRATDRTYTRNLP